MNVNILVVDNNMQYNHEIAEDVPLAKSIDNFFDIHKISTSIGFEYKRDTGVDIDLTKTPNELNIVEGELLIITEHVPHRTIEGVN